MNKTAYSFATLTAVIALGAVGACSVRGARPMYASRPAPSAPPPAPGATPPTTTTPSDEGGRSPERYRRFEDNPFLTADGNPLSTFGVDVDTASYANVRRFLREGDRPPADSVRIEELVNYFSYDYPAPAGDEPFSVDVETADAPWRTDNRLVRIALQGRGAADGADRPQVNIVFLLDVSGSMSDPNKLPLLMRSLSLLIDRLDERDWVSIVVYAGAAGLVLPPTPGNNGRRILDAVSRLQAGGSTNGGQGIRLAYEVAHRSFVTGGVNRVVLATDGDFNVGVTGEGELVRLVQANARKGVGLTVLGFGMGNYNDQTLEALADKGDGNYAYIDTLAEARKVLVRELGSTLVTIAKDVKVQVEWNPTRVAAWRLIGYENRVLRAEDFEDDDKDAGDIGAGHCVTALYEVVPAGVGATAADEVRDRPGLRYQAPTRLTEAASSGEMFTLKLRYKLPAEGPAANSVLREFVVEDGGAAMQDASVDFRWAAAVAGFGMLLRDSPHKGQVSWGRVLALASSGKGRDAHGYRAEFIELVQAAQRL